MGSDNLNRVFLKAYGKGAASNASKGEPAAPLMIRFDTATVHVPAPHMLAPPRQPARQPVAAAAPPSSQQAIAQSAPAYPVPEPQPEITQWDDTMMSILFGGSTVVGPSTSIGRRAIHNQQAPTNPQSNPQSQPQPNQTKSVEVRTTTEEALNRPSQHASQAAAPNPPTPASHGVVNASSLEENSKADIRQKIASLNQGGEIFRLDRPSYSETGQSSQAAEEFIDSDDSSHTAYDIELQRSMNPQAAATANPTISRHIPEPTRHVPEPNQANESQGSNNTIEKTKRREQRLRQARIKIFNPLWEVDRLEWPLVCNELSRTIDEGSAAIVDNLLRASQAGLQVLAVTSPQSGEGTSTVACCLAMLAGKHGMNIALVDSNIENPSLSYQTNLDLEVDWNDAVSKRMPLEEIAVHSVDDQVTLIPLLERLNSPELNEHNVAMMLQELSQSFDLVIVDLGHMSAQRNLVRKLGELGVINAVVAVVDRRLSSPERIEICLRQIRQTGVASIGLVENFAA
jgi:Mrp family chromosome partitioning ATPase